jgi:sugar phosphate permease
MKCDKDLKEEEYTSEQGDREHFKENVNENEINKIKNKNNKDELSLLIPKPLKLGEISHTPTDNASRVSRSEYLHHIYDKMEFTKSHFFLILSIFLIRTIEGTEVLSLSIASTMIEKSFNLSENMSANINVVILSGNFVGCIISMFIADKFPRKFLIKLGVICIILFGFVSIFSRTIWLFVLSRHLVNIGVGLILAGSTALVTESININYRGFVLNLILVSSSVGEIFISMCLGWIINLENVHEWSKLFFLAIVPVFFIFN